MSNLVERSLRNLRGAKLPYALMLCLLLPLIEFTCPAAVAQLKGDRELLQQIAVRIRGNSEAIQTWQGEAHWTAKLIGTIEGEAYDLTTVGRTEFAFDRKAEKLITLTTQMKESGKKGQREPDGATNLIHGGIRTADGYLRVMPWYADGRQGQPKRPVLILRPRSDEHPAELSPDFDPFQYYTARGSDVVELLMHNYKKAAEPERSAVSVTRNGNLVTFEMKGSKVTERDVFDLDQGANLIEAESISAEIHELYTHAFQRINDIWVPVAGTAKNTNKRSGVITEKSIHWTTNVVNETIPADRFSVEKLSIAKGDTVRDVRTGAVYKYEQQPDFNPRPETSRFWTYCAVIALFAVAAAIFLVSWRIRQKVAKEMKNAGAP